jgi:hypothetical protein
MEEAIQQVDVTWGRAIKVWWSIKWRLTLCMLVLCAGIFAIMVAVALMASMVGSRQALSHVEQEDAPSAIESEPVTKENEAITAIMSDPNAPPFHARPRRAPFIPYFTCCFMLLFMPIAFLIEIAVVKVVLRIRYSDFRIVLAKTDG